MREHTHEELVWQTKGEPRVGKSEVGMASELLGMGNGRILPFHRKCWSSSRITTVNTSFLWILHWSKRFS